VDRPELLVSRDSKVSLAQVVTVELLVQPETRAAMEIQDSPDLLEQRELPDHWEMWEIRDCGALPASQELRVHADRPDQRDLLETRAPLAHKVRRVQLDLPVAMDLKESRVLPVTQDLQDQQASWDCLEQPVSKDPRDPAVMMELRG
jgi:hypothetical protein